MYVIPFCGSKFNKISPDVLSRRNGGFFIVSRFSLSSDETMLPMTEYSRIVSMSKSFASTVRITDPYSLSVAIPPVNVL